VGANQSQSKIAAGIRARFVQVGTVFVLQALILILCSGIPGWVWAWVYLGISVLSVAVNGSIMLRINPETVAERGRPKETKAWDKSISGFYAFANFLLLPLVAGLDARFSWTGTIGQTSQLIGAGALALSLAWGGWAMISNAFFSTAVRIQTDRDQTVCRRGPYRFVRHPGYVGFMLQSVATSVLLGSLWALIPSLTAVIALGIRTYLEDGTLQAELPGYREYVKEVRYRLLPGIW